MKNAIILHGTCSKSEYYGDYPSGSNSHWLPWLQKQLLVKHIHAITPEMYQAYSPDYNHWKNEFERYDITDNTTLIGHSCGGGFLVRRLSENQDISVGKVVLVAPWLDPENSKKNDFFKFTIDKNLTTRTNGCVIFSSTNDDDDIKNSIETIKNAVSGITLKEFTDYGHFCLSDMGTNEFPELLEEIF